MKVLSCNKKQMIVILSLREFTGITGLGVKEYSQVYGGKNYSPVELENEEFELEDFINSVYSLKQASEVKKKIKDDLTLLIKKIDEATFPVNELCKQKEIEK